MKSIGPINSIVLSRAGGSDNIYLRDENSVQQNGLCELKISDNQIMNFNNRDEFLPEILNKLNGTEYYLNDFSSTGIMYYDLLDMYNVKIGDKTYNCLMLNDEQDITQGLEENIYTDRPEKSETDYTKADKTDRKINQTYIIVDKQNQQIEAVISQTTEQNKKINRVTQTVDELNSKISDIADITTSKESNEGFVEFEKVNQSEPIRLVIRPIVENISYLYPSDQLFPSDTLFPKSRTIRFENITKETYVDYELPTDLLYYDNQNYDEFILDYDAQTCLVNKKVGYNADGTTYVLETPLTLEYNYPQILLEDGDYKISVLGYSPAYIFARVMSQNIYTTQFATKAEVSSSINQTAQSINLSVDQKLTNYSTTTEMNSAINMTANEINSKVSKKVGNDEIISKINQSAEAISIKADKINLNGAVTANENFKIKSDGSMEAKNGTFTGGNISLSGGTNQNNAKFIIEDPNNNQKFAYITPNSIQIGDSSGNDGYFSFNEGALNVGKGNNGSYLQLTQRYDGTRGKFYMSVTDAYVTQGSIHALEYHYDSLAEKKKNIKLYEKNAIDIIKNTDVYEFNYKSQEDNYKKNIGFVIGDNYRTSKEIFTNDKVGINSYSVLGVLWKAVQEQQEQIELLQKEINKLKGENYGEN